MSLWKMAFRNVWRNPRRSWITIGAMAVALFVMVQYSGLVAGYMAHFRRQILQLEMGAVQVHAPGYRDNASLYKRVPDSDGLVKKLRESGLKASARLLGAGLAASKDNSSGAMLIGLDPATDRAVSEVYSSVTKGTWLSADKPEHVVLGRYLAKTLEVQPGGEVVLLSQAADGSQANAIYTVAGVLGEVGGGVDQAGIFLLDRTFRELMAVEDGAHRILVAPVDGMTPQQIAEQVAAIAPKQDVKTWQELKPTMAQMVQSAEAAVSIMFLIVYVVIGILLLNTMLMAVFERIRELGVMKALGYGPVAVMKLIVYESGVQTAVAIGIAAVLSVPTGWYLATSGLPIAGDEGITLQGMPIARDWIAIHSVKSVAMPLSLLLFIVAAAVAYPAIKAALIQPVDAIRHR